MPHSLVLDMPVKLGLPFVSTIRANSVDSKGELVDDMIDEVDRTLLIVPLIYLQRTYPSRIVNGCELVATDLPAVVGLQGEELDIDLDLVSRDSFGVAAGMDGSPTDVAGQWSDPIALERSIDT